MATKLLVVDDMGLARTIVTKFGKEMGFKDCIEAKNGKDALDLLQVGTKFDLALIDIEMPRLNGLELLKAIRTNPVCKNLPCVFVSTKDQSQNIDLFKEAKKYGLNGYIKKPFTAITFCREICRVMDSL